MKSFEYKFVQKRPPTTIYDFQNQINGFGMNGWKIINIYFGEFLTVVLEREIEG